MSWPTTKLGDLDSFFRTSSALIVGRPSHIGYVWRGQADASWPVSSTLGRCLEPTATPGDALEAERVALQEFKSQVHLHMRTDELPHDQDILGWWQLMRHHGVPTRLVDWTASPYVAAYFAVCERWDCDGAIWYFHGLDLKTSMDRLYGAAPASLQELAASLFDAAAMPRIMTEAPWRKSQRMLAQQSLFTVCFQPRVDHSYVIETALMPIQQTDPRDALVKVEIPAALKPDILRKLRAMNVTASLLFPGVDGLGKSVAELLYIEAEMRRGITRA